MDFEMGMGTIGRRLQEVKNLYGDAEQNLQVWTPFINKEELNLKTKQGLLDLQEWVDHANPDVLVIDTVRSAFPGLQENSADEWARVNSLAVSLRNAGIAVILVHHSNKPTENGVGREAGSTNQLTVLDTQIRIMQVFNDEEAAKINAGIYDDGEQPIWERLDAALPPEANLYMAVEVRYGKVREWTELHDRHYHLGWGADADNKRYLVSSRSSKQKAKELAVMGIEPTEIAVKLKRNVSLVEDWLSS